MSAATEQVSGRDLRVGDVLMFLGHAHVITSLAPYAGPLLAELGEGTRIARAEPDWGMVVEPGGLFEVCRRPS